MTNTTTALQWNPADLEATGRIVGTLMAHSVHFRHPSGLGETTTLQIGDTDGPIAQPGDWIVADGGRWGIVRADRYGNWTAARERHGRVTQAIRDADGHWCMYQEGIDAEALAKAALAVMQPDLDKLTEERDLAVAHDQQPYPTAWAYDQACKAVRKHRDRADAIAATLREVLAVFTTVTVNNAPTPSGHVAPHPVAPADFARWTAVADPADGPPPAACFICGSPNVIHQTVAPARLCGDCFLCRCGETPCVRAGAFAPRCRAEYHGPDGPRGRCRLAEGHDGLHRDAMAGPTGFNWAEIVAVYPVVDVPSEPQS
ncbi:hypothetical protein V2S66_31500 [Streptomyces sp. V4-01]|uniref:Uncharacterized protein n=1 Tax=Actinacidiphila polyblastidii TaxID=3110430 RepID=A0ABU7PLC0_9ACTN|nr:hypothetical protein [Streptomyces sp. V4-01]